MAKTAAKKTTTTKSTKNARTKSAKPRLPKVISAVIQAAQDRKATVVVVLALKKPGAFTDYFVICYGSNPRQVQAISDEVELRLKGAGMRPTHIEGYKQAEWVLLDYVDFVVHVFSEKARKFYDLERLWKSARRMEPAELVAAPARQRRTPVRGLRKKRA